jgi:hypothetical protein
MNVLFSLLTSSDYVGTKNQKRRINEKDSNHFGLPVLGKLDSSG